MASKGAVLPLLRRELRPTFFRITRASSFSTIASSARGPTSNLPTWSAVTGRRPARHTALLTRGQGQHQIRSFSQSLSRNITDDQGHFDPLQVDRESDEVDVCIVGGGKDGRD